MRCWRDHSLTIVSFLIGTGLTASAYFLKEGTWFDIVAGIGTAFVGVAGYGFLTWVFREVRRPDD